MDTDDSRILNPNMANSPIPKGFTAKWPKYACASPSAVISDSITIYTIPYGDFSPVGGGENRGKEGGGHSAA